MTDCLRTMLRLLYLDHWPGMSGHRVTWTGRCLSMVKLTLNIASSTRSRCAVGKGKLHAAGTKRHLRKYDFQPRPRAEDRRARGNKRKYHTPRGADPKAQAVWHTRTPQPNL